MTSADGAAAPAPVAEPWVGVLSKLMPPTFAGVEEWYDWASPDHFWFQWRFAALTRFLRDLRVPLDRPAHAFDIGCGTAVLGRQLESAGAWTVDGADLNLGALNRAYRGRGRLFYYNIFDAHPDLVGRYDVVTLLDVIEHIDDDKAFLEAALKHLKPGGLLIVGVPALQALYGAYDRAAGHVRRYNRRSLGERCAGLPLSVLGTRYWGLPNLPLLLLRKMIMANHRPGDPFIQRGFTPPGRLADGLLRLMMRSENLLLPRPPAGSSLLLAARKT